MEDSTNNYAYSVIMKSIDHDIEEYHYQPSCFDGFDFNNIEWDRMEYEHFAELLGVMPLGVARV